MTTTVHLQVVYDGTALANNEMDVRELAPALMAIGDVLEEANRLFNGEHARVQINVKGSFKTGSFGIDLSVVQGWARAIKDLITSREAANAAVICTLLGVSVLSSAKGFLQLIKWVRNRKITRVVIMEDGNVRVEVDQDHLEVEERVIELYRNYKLRQAFERVLKPLDQEGIDHFAITDNPESGQFVEVSKSERSYFATPKMEDEEIADESQEINLQLVNVAFQEDNKWRFSDGNSTFHAVINDDDFLNKVQRNDIAFAKNDVLRVRLRRHQWLGGDGKMRTDYEIEKVLDHRSAARQLRLPFERA